MKTNVLINSVDKWVVQGGAGKVTKGIIGGAHVLAAPSGEPYGARASRPIHQRAPNEEGGATSSIALSTCMESMEAPSTRIWGRISNARKSSFDHSPQLGLDQT